MDKVRIGIIGLGWGKWHLDNFLKTDKAEVIALCDANEEQLKKLGAEKKIKRLYKDVGSILKDKDVDAVSVCIPNFLHKDVVTAAVKSGKHVLCEKPLAGTVHEARSIVKAVEKSRKKCMIAMKFRFTPEAHYISRELKKGEFGKIYYGYTHYLLPRSISTCPENWRISKSKSGGGALIDNGVHLLDLNWYLMGCPKPVFAFGSIYAEFGPKIKEIKDRFDVEDFGCGLIKFENGATIYLDNALACMVDDTIIGLRICGTKSGATMWPFSVIKSVDGKNQAVKPDLTHEHYQTQFEHFVECIINDSEPISPPRQGLEILKMLHGIYHSSKIGKAVRIKNEVF